MPYYNDPCASGHQELKLMTKATTLLDDMPVMFCYRCGNTMSFEEAVRNDERIRIAAAIEAYEPDQFQHWRSDLEHAAEIARRGGQELSR